MDHVPLRRPRVSFGWAGVAIGTLLSCSGKIESGSGSGGSGGSKGTGQTGTGSSQGSSGSGGSGGSSGSGSSRGSGGSVGASGQSGTGTGGDGSGGTGSGSNVPIAAACAPGPIQPGPSPLRRLTRFEYNNTVAALLGDKTSPADDFPLEEQSVGIGFDNDANVLKVTRLLTEAYVTASQNLSDAVIANLKDRLSCAATAATADTATQEKCVGTFIDQLAPKTYRRPLTADERTRLIATFRSGRAFLDFAGSVGAVLESMLLSPQFLYRLENGTPVNGTPGVLQVDSWGLAARLSYFLWASMPDDTLTAAASSGKLATAADVRAQAERMYADDKTRAVVRHFNRYWLDIGGVDTQRKDPTLFPDYSSTMGTLFRTQTETFAEHLYFDGGGTLKELLTAPYSYMNKTLAKFLGVTGPTDDTFVKVSLDPTRRAGLLTDPSVLSWSASADRPDSILRGVFIRSKIFCDPPPAPPPNVVDSRGTVTDPNATERDRLAAHRINMSCNSCHQFIDPPGLAFLNFDAVGRWRTMDGANAVDASGDLPNTDVAGALNGPVELAAKAAQSAEVSQCMAVNWFRFANGRGEDSTDTCSIGKLNKVMSTSGGDLRELVLSLTQADSFLYRTVSK